MICFVLTLLYFFPTVERNKTLDHQRTLNKPVNQGLYTPLKVLLVCLPGFTLPLPGGIIANLSPNKTWKRSLGSVLSAKASEIRMRAVCCSGSGQQELALHCLAAQETVMSAILGWTAELVVCRHFFFPSLFHF